MAEPLSRVLLYFPRGGGILIEESEGAFLGANMSNRFTERAQRVILIAQEEAKRLNHDYVGTEHILLGLIALGEGVAAQVLANLGVDLRRVRSEIEKIV